MTWASECVGWLCRNGHWNDRVMTTTVCLDCGAVRNPGELYETVNISVSVHPDVEQSGNITITGRSGADRFRSKAPKRGGGFICFRCAEMVPIARDSRAPWSGFEQPGTQIEVFMNKEDLKWHIKSAHRGKRYADRELRRLKRESEKRADFKQNLRDAVGK